VGRADAAGAQLPWSAGAAWIDGRYCPIEEAKISVLDLGVTRSDCTYDVVHVWRGRFYRLDDHLDRFSASLARLRLDPGRGRTEIDAILHGCVRRAGLREAYVSMTCTRGRMAAGSRDLRTARNIFYCFAIPFVWISSPDRQVAGASMRVSQVVRIPPQSVDPSVKNYHWLDLDLALLDAYDHDAELVVLRDLSGAITEGPGYNVFAHLDGRWLTPRSGTLGGITRRSVIELAGQAGQPVEEGRLSDGDLRRAAEVLVTSTAGGVMPVTVIDGAPVGTGAPGPLTRQLRDLYWASHQDPRYSTPVRYHERGGRAPRRAGPRAGRVRYWSAQVSRFQRLTVVLVLNLSLVAGTAKSQTCRWPRSCWTPSQMPPPRPA
jgi:branched-chain amino acid aminotransferase